MLTFFFKIAICSDLIIVSSIIHMTLWFIWYFCWLISKGDKIGFPFFFTEGCGLIFFMILIGFSLSYPISDPFFTFNVQNHKVYVFTASKEQPRVFILPSASGGQPHSSASIPPCMPNFLLPPGQNPDLGEEAAEGLPGPICVFPSKVATGMGNSGLKGR